MENGVYIVILGQTNTQDFFQEEIAIQNYYI